MIQVGIKALADAYQEGIPITFRAESVREDLYVCRAEWSQDGVGHYALTKRFRATSDQKADLLADEMLRGELASLSREKA